MYRTNVLEQMYRVNKKNKGANNIDLSGPVVAVKYIDNNNDTQ